ncbi:helix-turn-helix transcriptional regulator [Pseudomonas syringae pv. coryli]|uniref:helix-turn-helix transcriptional regulator n=1 Tax=Pseudomonas syringae pv. coryli TaxID=317659 RepID=UPI003D2CEED5
MTPSEPTEKDSLSAADAKKKMAETLIELRQEAGHTQQEAADFLYTPKRTYQNWEYGKSRIPPASLELYELKAIARGLIKRPSSKRPK